MILKDKYFNGCEDKYCKVFGCGIKLTLNEKLFGDTCIKCFKTKKDEVHKGERNSN